MYDNAPGLLYARKRARSLQMVLLKVDEEKCDLCRLCVAACPAGDESLVVAATVDGRLLAYQ